MPDVFNGAPGQGFNTTEGDERYVQESEHTKALHDALLIDADTLDDLNSTDLALADGTRLRIYRSTTAPSSPAAGQLWADTTTTPPLIKNWTGSAWEVVSATDHGALGGLGDDDHAIYALSNGTRLRVYRSPSSPSSPSSGQLWADTNTSPATLKDWDGGAWEALAGSGGGGGGGGGSSGPTVPEHRSYIQQITTSAISATAPAPATHHPGDLYLLQVVHRSALDTETGTWGDWALVSSSSATHTASAVTQHSSIFLRRVEGTSITMPTLHFQEAGLILIATHAISGGAGVGLRKHVSVSNGSSVAVTADPNLKPALMLFFFDHIVRVNADTATITSSSGGETAISAVTGTNQYFASWRKDFTVNDAILQRTFALSGVSSANGMNATAVTVYLDESVGGLGGSGRYRTSAKLCKC